VVERREAIFQRTACGAAAEERAASRLPERYRAVLEFIDAPTPFELLAASLPDVSKEQIASCLSDLEAIGLVESVSLDWLFELHLLAFSGESSAAKAEYLLL
jgi:hypothetical protein